MLGRVFTILGNTVEVRSPEGVFRSHNLMVKHSNEYRAPHEGEKPAEYYRQLFKEQQQP